ncbi:MAG: hypothetical protein GX862_01235, partial [Leucobacter sp.]|nr:hypothetical protein [Leucobacter sp.]
MTSSPFSRRAQLRALDSIVGRLETSEKRRRAEDAAQLKVLAEAVEMATAQDSAALKNEHSSLAYRAVRSEIACALNMSEQSVERRMSHAYELIQHYFITYMALREGEISLAHTE